jgi:hypothetical protein
LQCRKAQMVVCCAGMNAEGVSRASDELCDQVSCSTALISRQVFVIGLKQSCVFAGVYMVRHILSELLDLCSGVM